MLTIIKLKEGYVVVDLDEDTPVFESLDEAGELMLEYMSQKKLDKYKAGASKHMAKGIAHAKKARDDFGFIKGGSEKHDKIADKHYDKAGHMQNRLDQRRGAAMKLKAQGKLKKAAAED